MATIFNRHQIAKVLGVLIILELVGAGIFLSTLPRTPSSGAPELTTTDLPGAEAQLGFQAPVEEIKAGQTFTIPIILKLNRPTVISVVDTVIAFDDQVLQVIGAEAEAAGTPVFQLPVNVVDQTNHQVLLTWYTQDEQPVPEEVTLGTITLKALTSGETELRFESTTGVNKGSSVFPTNSERNILTGSGTLVISIVE